MAARDDLFLILAVFFLVLKRPAAAPGDPDPIDIRLLEQPQHLLEIGAIDVGQQVLLCEVDLAAPPGPFGFPALESSAIQPDETKISLFRPRRHIFRLGPIQSRRRLKRLRGAEEQGGSDQTNHSYCSYDSGPLHRSLPSTKTTTVAKRIKRRMPLQP